MPDGDGLTSILSIFLTVARSPDFDHVNSHAAVYAVALRARAERLPASVFT